MTWRLNRRAGSELYCWGCEGRTIKAGDRYCWNTQPNKKHVLLCAKCVAAVNRRFVHELPPRLGQLQIKLEKWVSPLVRFEADGTAVPVTLKDRD